MFKAYPGEMSLLLGNKSPCGGVCFGCLNNDEAFARFKVEATNDETRCGSYFIFFPPLPSPSLLFTLPVSCHSSSTVHPRNTRVVCAQGRLGGHTDRFLLQHSRLGSHSVKETRSRLWEEGDSLWNNVGALHVVSSIEWDALSQSSRWPKINN